MAVMVDALREYPDVDLPFKRWCHMTSDADFEELHAAQEVGTRELTARMSGPRGDRVRARRRGRLSPPR